MIKKRPQKKTNVQYDKKLLENFLDYDIEVY